MATPEDRERSAKVAIKLLPHVVPLILLPSREANPSDVIYSGSGALVNTGQKKLLVTCEHVWTAFNEYRKDHPESVIGMSTGNDIHVINCLPLVGTDKNVDIAILDLGDGWLLEDSTKEFCVSGEWPPPRPEPGDFLVAIGFPGKSRQPNDVEDVLTFSTLDIEDEIVSVSERHIALADETRVREIISHLDDGIPECISLGGISGCPAFVYRRARFEFAGVVYEADEGGNGILYASHADFITSVGEIDWSRIPPK